MSKQFYFKQFSISSVSMSKTVPFQARVDLGAMAMKGCSAFPKAPVSMEPQLRTLIGGGGSYHPTEVQSAYSTAPAE